MCYSNCSSSRWQLVPDCSLPPGQVDVDIGSSSVASSVTSLVCGATKSLVIDLGVLLEVRLVVFQLRNRAPGSAADG